jgi:hypothetical protein
MVEDYSFLFHSILQDAFHGFYKRPRGPINLPPAQIGEVSILPLHYAYVRPRTGKFPTRLDYLNFQIHRNALAERKLPFWIVPIRRSARKTGRFLSFRSLHLRQKFFKWKRVALRKIQVNQRRAGKVRRLAARGEMSPAIYRNVKILFHRLVERYRSP